jgi:hypothetical protein
VTRDYAWLGESSAKKKKKKKKKEVRLLLLSAAFFGSLLLRFLSFSLFPFRATKTLSLSPLQLFFLPQHIIRGQGS